MKKERLKTDSAYDFDGSIDTIISNLKSVKKEFEKLGYTDISLEIEDEWGYYDEHDINVIYYGRKKCIKTSTSTKKTG